MRYTDFVSQKKTGFSNRFSATDIREKRFRFVGGAGRMAVMRPLPAAFVALLGLAVTSCAHAPPRRYIPGAYTALPGMSCTREPSGSVPAIRCARAAPVVQTSAPPVVKRYPQIVAGIIAANPKLRRDVKFQECKKHADAVYDVAFAEYRSTDYRPDMRAISRLRSCLLDR